MDLTTYSCPDVSKINVDQAIAKCKKRKTRKRMNWVHVLNSCGTFAITFSVTSLVAPVCYSSSDATLKDMGMKSTFTEPKQNTKIA